MGLFLSWLIWGIIMLTILCLISMGYFDNWGSYQDNNNDW